MGCQLQLSTEQAYFRTGKVKAVRFLHIVRAIMMITMSFIVDDVFLTLVGFGVVELFIAWWFWSLKMESWGLSMGVCIVQLLFPVSFGISIFGGIVILGTAAVQIVVLALIRIEGGYSFSQLAYLDQADTREATVLQSRMFHLAVLAQAIKSLVVLVGGLVALSFLGWFEPIPWLPPIPLVPLTFMMGLVNLTATCGFFTGRDWGFHLTVIMVPVSFIETMLTLNGLIFLFGIWILTILFPCLAKDGFYIKLFKRIREKSGRHTQEVIKSQELTSSSDIE
ncbi:MAG: hypothetical protein ACFFCX_07785 [Candidatus Sifarchaeia archaeon]